MSDKLIYCDEMKRLLSMPDTPLFVSGGALFDSKPKYLTTNNILMQTVTPTYPSTVDFHQWNTGKVNQSSYGICYMCATVHYAEYLIWRYLGIKTEFTFNETLDCACDYYGYSYDERIKKANELFKKTQTHKIAYGGHFSPKSLYEYNNNLNKHYFTKKTKLDKCTLFQKVVNQLNNQISIITYNHFSDQNGIKNILAKHGAVYFSFDCKLWGSTGGHAILATGYNSDGIWCLNSWGSHDKYFFKWDELKKYAWDFKYLSPTNLRNFN